MRSDDGTRLRVRQLVILHFVLVVANVGCAAEPPPPSDPELRAELGIGDEVVIHRVDLTGRGDRTRVLPTETRIRPGDVVQFVVLDRRVYLVSFDADGLSSSAWAFLRETGQDLPPPLVERGARLVLSFDDAPSGSYPFLVEGNGASVPGVIRVDEGVGP